jgi:MATE family multidrug resistance protein
MEAVTHRRVLAISLPIVLSNATIPILGAVDTAVVGQMGQAAPIGAVGMGAVILASVYWIFGFLRMGTTGLAAQAHGAGDSAEAGAILKRGLLIAAAAGLAMIALQGPLFAAAFWVAPASDRVEGLASQYLAIRIWGAPATIGAYALTGWLIALLPETGGFFRRKTAPGLNDFLSPDAGPRQSAEGKKYQAGIFFAYEACGLSFRCGGEIMDNMSKFVAHIIK